MSNVFSIQGLLKRIRAKQTEQRTLIDQLELWEVVKSVGILPKDVKAFTFRPGFLTREQKQEERRHANSNPGHFRGLYDRTHFNCVRLKSGSLVPIPLTKRPAEMQHGFDTSRTELDLSSGTPHSESRS